MLARLTGQYSRLGTLMDPFLDRALVLSGVVVAWKFELLAALGARPCSRRASSLMLLIVLARALRRASTSRSTGSAGSPSGPRWSAIGLALIADFWLAEVLPLRRARGLDRRQRPLRQGRLRGSSVHAQPLEAAVVLDSTELAVPCQRRCEETAVLKAVVMAGGEGTQASPAHLQPAQADGDGRRAAVHGAHPRARPRHGITQLVATLAYMPQIIRGYFGEGSHLGVELDYSVEEVPAGTAGSVKLCEHYLDETFLVVSRRRAHRHRPRARLSTSTAAAARSRRSRSSASRTRSSSAS